MNSRQLIKLGVPESCVKQAIAAVQSAVSSKAIRGAQVKAMVSQVLDSPTSHLEDEYFAGLACAVIEDRQVVEECQPVAYRTWGADGIDEQAHAQMQTACRLPIATGGALMADAHLGYGLPIGGVLACENAVIPYAVGVDIACRMKLSILDMPVESLQKKFSSYCQSLEKGTRFGVGVKYDRPQTHEVMDRDWSVSRITRQSKDKAWHQLGTSGSGNHFAEFGVLDIPAEDTELGLASGQYVALLSHSGSRGTGAAVCSTYSAIARKQLPKRYADFGRLAWLSMDSQEGQEYWLAMNLMGEYASANHAVLHRNVTKLLGAKVLGGVENHHNFAWKEVHNGQEVIVHRKGATPASAGELGVIPGSMNDPAFVVRGKGNAQSLNSASHGAGRCMSRTAAKSKYNFKAIKNDLEKKGVHVLSAGADEVPGVYKNILDVMSEQSDLVEVVARFDPKIVKMCGDGSRAED